jgi:probable HAF family extracellular repeat protein
MKILVICGVCVVFLFSALALPARLVAQNEAEQGHGRTFYVVHRLSTLGGTQGVGEAINNKGWISGAANLPGDSTEHAAIWRNGRITDLGTLGGPNSRVVGGVKNTRGVVAGGSETSSPDPLGETVCTTFVAGFSGQPLVCLGFVWRNGTMTALPTLGGNNGFAFGGVNNRGQIVGFAENRTQDPACPSPQVLDFEAVVWGPAPGQIQELPPYSGDTVGIAAEMNDHGQAVGVTGLCSALSTAIAHAVLWQNGSAIDLGNLGSQLFNWAYTINERGQVAGAAGLTGDATWHAFLWQDGAMTDLGVLPGDVMSQSNGMNNIGQVVGTSCNDINFDICHAFVWQDGAMTDLNDLIPANSALQLVIANDINDRGEIAGYAYDPSTGDGPGFLAIPCDKYHAHVAGCQEAALGRLPLSEAGGGLKLILPENVREQIRLGKNFARFRPRLSEMQ